MLTQKDLNLLQEVFVTKLDFDSKIKLLPTKEEFFSRMDKLSKEIQDARDELTLHIGRHDEIDEDLNRIKTHLRLS